MMPSRETIDQLAIFGGMPAFSEPLHVGRPNVLDRARFLERVNMILDSRWLTNNGPFVQAFERAAAEITSVRHCVAVCNGTVGLELLVRALDLSGEVIIPSFTFAATANALAWLGLTPVFCDIDPATHNIQPEAIEALISPRTSGILGVHVWGRACAVDELSAIARRRSLRLLFDAAHAFGCSYHGRPIGNFGEAEVFSFHATKYANAFEGGVITTNDDELAARLRRLRNFGFRDADQVIEAGINGKMSEVSAAMGLTSLENLETLVEVNRTNYQKYLKELNAVPGIGWVQYDDAEKNNYQYVIAEIEETASGISRDELMRVLHAENILVRRYFYPGCHQMEAYRRRPGMPTVALPATESLVERTLCFPTGTGVGAEEIHQIAQIVALAVRHGSAIRQQLATTA